MLRYTSYLLQDTAKKWTLGAKRARSTDSCSGSTVLVRLCVNSLFFHGCGWGSDPCTAFHSSSGKGELLHRDWPSETPQTKPGGGLDLNCFFSAKITPFWRLLCPSTEVWAAAVILPWMKAFLLSHILLFPVYGVLAYYCAGDYPSRKTEPGKMSHFQQLWN